MHRAKHNCNLELNPNHSYENCHNTINNIKIEGNKMIKVTQCKLEVNSIILSESLLKPVKNRFDTTIHTT